jgi:glycerol-3-phosphate acyltransferase PlsX
MGGDFGPRVTVPAALKSLSEHPELLLTLVGDQKLIAEQLGGLKQKLLDRIDIYHTDEVIRMDDKPSAALRSKRDSSMRICLNLIKEDKAQACVSAGNTGALMALGSYVLKKQQGLNRPAICSTIPTLNGHSYLLDLGANVDSDAVNLLQFAIMGGALSRALDGRTAPKVALLNIGQEQVKGNSQVKEAAQLLQDCSHINYIGFVEGNGLFAGEADVIVCDGFAGNVALKTSEGAAVFIAKKISKGFSGSMTRRLLGWLVSPVLKSVYQQIDPRVFNGATFLGLQGVVVKSHGNADAFSFSRAIELALNGARSDIVEIIDQQFRLSFD